ncbi:Vps51/Vps67-domain-containing protein [Lentinula raphanica]|uniref:Vacuolar protein sorting-associated protein 51 homolog n=1 Tax=Lentinula raphanica TaxID=153919 RepID=A0AA38PCY8_9AGAR|nr:Vps51/Vps67-domain-containing protein [Lentinula raphanica]KAJ3840618.1 Vps51/Vps67-domain-containing protein [Lentinula raphanica]
MSNHDLHRRSLPPAATGSPLRPTSSTPPPLPSTTTRTTNTPSPTRPVPKAPTTPPARTATRARDLLRKHYGLGMGTPSSSGRNTPDERDPMNMDSPSFDAKAYYSQLITTANLSTLLKKENELIGEIRLLDSERQNLVYNHHHELIAASDTIGAMKSQAESLDADLDLLKAAFSEISRLSSELASVDQVNGRRSTPAVNFESRTP